MSGSAGEMAGEPGHVDPPDGPPAAETPLEARSNRARQLRETAATLTKESHRLRARLPAERDKDPVVFWRSGLDVMKGHIERVTMLLEDCDLLIERIGAAEHDAGAADAAASAADGDEGEDADQMELEALREGLTQCQVALYDAVEAWMTAFDALNRTRSSGSSRAGQYREAAAQLGEIAGHCQGLADKLAGEAALP